jgi:hypothetical protein
MGPIHWIHGWGLAYGIYPGVSALVMEDLMGKHFLGGLLIFSWGDPGTRERVRARSAGSVVGRHSLSSNPILFFIIYGSVEVSL